MGNVYVNEEVCIGCHLCEAYFRLQHAGKAIARKNIVEVTVEN